MLKDFVETICRVHDVFSLNETVATTIVKQIIYKNVNKLNGKNIYFNDDLYFEDRQERKILVKHNYFEIL